MAKTKLPFGTWPSTVTAATISEAIQIPEAAWSPDGKILVWLEEHSGQGILYAAALDGEDPRRITGDQSVRATVGYGGGNFTVGRDSVYFVERGGRIHAQSLGHGEAYPLTPAGMLCSSPVLSADGCWLAFVYEQEHQTGLAVVHAKGRQWPLKIAEGMDFYMHPVWDPAGVSLAWIAWQHPNMPWDGTRLFTVTMRESQEGPRPDAEPEAIAGGDREAVIQPEYSPDGKWLTYISDREGWFQIYRHDRTGAVPPLRLTDESAEFGGAAWQMGMRWYAWQSDSRSLVATRNKEGAVQVVRVDAEGGNVTPLTPAGSNYSTLIRPQVNQADGRVAMLAAGDGTPNRLIVLGGSPGVGPDRSKAPHVVRRSAREQTSPDDLAQIRAISWRSESGQAVHGLFAAPRNARSYCEGAPPVIVQIHGGPTSQAYRTWRPDLQYFTSRGYAFLDINHRGSSGYGRAYREQLREQWGVLDVEDAISGLRYVGAQGWADPSRGAIRGGSAGGYTVLRALTLHPDAFKAGVCMYGISDLFSLARETHKFEAHYLDSLIGPLPHTADRYRERSPLFSAERIRAPIIIFQGEEDRVVPPSQSARIVASLKARGIPHEYHSYAGEGHGFRKNETVRACLEATERFLLTHLVYA